MCIPKKCILRSIKASLSARAGGGGSSSTAAVSRSDNFVRPVKRPVPRVRIHAMQGMFTHVVGASCDYRKIHLSYVRTGQPGEGMEYRVVDPRVGESRKDVHRSM